MPNGGAPAVVPDDMTYRAVDSDISPAQRGARTPSIALSVAHLLSEYGDPYSTGSTTGTIRGDLLDISILSASTQKEVATHSHHRGSTRSPDAHRSRT